MEKEQIIIAWNSLNSSKILGKIDNIDETNFENELNNNGNTTKVDNVENDENNYFLIIFNNTNHEYIFDKNEKITFNNTTVIEENEVTKYMITFNPNGGTLDENTKYLAEGDKLGTLPIPTMNDVVFKGWYTKDGEIITENTLMEKRDITYYARWRKDLNNSSSIAETIELIPTSEIPFEIRVNDNISENIIIPNDANIVIDLQNYTLQNKSNANIINNNGNLEIINGTIESTAGNYAVIDNNGTGTIVIKNVNIISNNKQAVCNKGGNIYIEGNSFITSKNAYTIDNRSRNSLYY